MNGSLNHATRASCRSQYPFAVASLAFGWTLGFGYFVVCHAVRETRRTRRFNTYVILIWSQILVSSAFAIICWLYLKKIIPHSFAYFFSILTLWALQVQLLLQIIVNRICILLRNDRERNLLKYGTAGLILIINISVYNIWIPAKLQINQQYHDINIWWDRIEKCLYLVVDAALNWFFIRSVKRRLVDHGLKKYDRLVRFNTQIVGVSLAMDVLIIAMMSLPNDFVYMQFHPVAYTVKLNIEMAMGQLIIKVAKSTGTFLPFFSRFFRMNTYFQGSTCGKTRSQAQPRTPAPVASMAGVPTSRARKSTSIGMCSRRRRSGRPI
ncbi:hypothetical protein C8R43DRAFT_1067986 [Mycena crocata]|nr:hypothetical protein C8R43DRAFT_1067986 [Mycena crocata]